MGVPSESPQQARKHAAEVLEWQFEKAQLNNDYRAMNRIATVRLKPSSVAFEIFKRLAMTLLIDVAARIASSNFALSWFPYAMYVS
jgi:hypothetical protein